MRYVSKPTEQDIQEAKLWIRQNQTGYDDAFDMSVECSHSLEIFDKDEHTIDPKETHSIPTWISNLTESYFSGEWE